MTIDIPALRALLAAATPGRWAYVLHREDGGTWASIHRQHANGLPLPGQIARTLRTGDDDAKLIVSLRNEAPALLDELERLRTYETESKKLLDDAQGWLTEQAATIHAQDVTLRVRDEELLRLRAFRDAVLAEVAKKRFYPDVTARKICEIVDAERAAMAKEGGE